MIINSSDADLVNVLADSVIKLVPKSIQMISSNHLDKKVSSYKLIV